MTAMVDLTEQAMADGCFGMSSGLAYAPGPYAALDELVELARVVSRHGGIYTSHIRNQTESMAAAVQEVIDVGRGAGPRLAHAARGADAGGDRQTAGGDRRAAGRGPRHQLRRGSLHRRLDDAQVPPAAVGARRGDAALIAPLRDPAERERIKGDALRHGAESGGSRKRNLIKSGAWEKIRLGSARANARLCGKDFREISRIRERATYQAPYAYSEGIDMVFVNGRLACEQGEPLDVRAGRVLRHGRAEVIRAAGQAAR